MPSATPNEIDRYVIWARKRLVALSRKSVAERQVELELLIILAALKEFEEKAPPLKAAKIRRLITRYNLEALI